MLLALLYITYETIDDAKRISSMLLKEKLVGCVNIFPIQSMYWWQGEVVDSSEFVSIVKTTPALVDKVRAFVLKNHPAEVPCVLEIRVSANKSYADWIKRAVTSIA